jgi:hypothetical protein
MSYGLFIEFKRGDQIGAGSISTVHAAFWSKASMTVAVKYLNDREINVSSF